MNAFSALPSVKTTCPYCGVGCGVAVVPDGAGGAHVEGDKAHPANLGRLCSKGAALGETLGLSTRLLYPMMRAGDGPLARTSWAAALDKVAADLRAIIDRHGPGAVAFYLSGQLLTEDYYVANKLAKGFLGTAHVDTNSRLCMASSVAGHKRAFGSDTVPGCYEDLEAADLVVLVGSNAAFCHPVLFRRMEAARAKRGTRIVVIDPRGTQTAAEADLVLPLAHGTDAVLFAGLLVHLAETGRVDPAFIAAHTQGYAATLDAAREIAATPAATARACGLEEADVAAFFHLFAGTEKVVTCYSQGVNQARQGTDKVGAILNCHLATGRIGKPGLGPFSLTGQPNAMGGREVGGLANQLAAHMGFSPAEVDLVRRFWSAPRMAEREGLKAVDMFAAIGRGEIKPEDLVRAVYPEWLPPRPDERMNGERAPNGDGWFELKRAHNLKFKIPEGASAERLDAIPIRGINGDLPVRFAPNGGAVPGDRIVGILTPGEGITIYPIQSPALQNFEDRPEQWLDVRWDLDELSDGRFPAQIMVTARNEPGSLAQVAGAIGDRGGNIEGLQMHTRSADFTEMLIDVEVFDLRHLNAIVADLKARAVVSSVERVNG